MIISYFKQFTIFIRRAAGESETIYDRIISTCLYLIVLLVPLYFLPITSDYLEINKAFLFYLLVLVASVAWLTKMIVNKQVNFRRTFLDLPLALFIIIYVLATIFSRNRYMSLVGDASYMSDSLI